MASDARILVIACGALAREIVALTRTNRWEALEVKCLPPELHNRPEQIPSAVRDAIREGRKRFEHIFVAYADCGTGGRLDAVLADEKAERLPGAHCYQFYATTPVFEELAAEEPGTFYLTDFLARHFDRLVISVLGIDRHPELAAEYFRHYRRLVYLVQSREERLSDAARAAAARLGLAYEERYTGYGELASSLESLVVDRTARPPREQSIAWRR
jgi:hypothetical protein